MERYIWCVDNIIIYGGNTEVEHQAIVEKLLYLCVENELALNLLQSQFHIHEPIFLDLVINGKEVKMDSSKLVTMLKWPISVNQKQVLTFTAFANYFRRFINNHSTTAHPIFHLIKHVPFT